MLPRVVDTGVTPVRRLDSLTGMRFVAALAVVLLHIGDQVVGGRFEAATYLGFVGVTFFFVLSGFVLTWAYRYVEAPLERRISGRTSLIDPRTIPAAELVRQPIPPVAEAGSAADSRR